MNKLGFGFLRLPHQGTEIDYTLVNRMVDTFIAGGGTYFDTAYTYLNGLSEEAIRRCLVERYPRECYRLADKLPGYLLKSEAECEIYFQEQCRRCGVEWFDVYLLHWLNRDNYEIAVRLREFEFLRRLKDTGRTKKIGFSYHGDAELLDEILCAHPEVDIVQLQINYLDWNDPAIESRMCYETAVRHEKQVVVMEPVKGGTLANLPEDAAALLKGIKPEESTASWAIRFAQSLPGVEVVLSGMNSMEQLHDNLRDMPPITETERELLKQVAIILNREIAIACTGCGYCVSQCPKSIPIPDYFSIYNSYCRHPKDDWKIQPIYARIAQHSGKASQCVSCHRCEHHCPQQIKITQWLPKIAAVME